MEPAVTDRTHERRIDATHESSRPHASDPAPAAKSGQRNAGRRRATESSHARSTDTPTDLALPTLDVRALARRAAVPAAARRDRGRCDRRRRRPARGPSPTRSAARWTPTRAGSSPPRLRGPVLRRLRLAALARRQPRERPPRLPRQHADHARRRGRDPPAADRRRRRRGADDLVLPPRRPRRPRRDAHAPHLPRPPLRGLPRRDRRRRRRDRARPRRTPTARSR